MELNNNIENIDISANGAARYCYFCYALLDNNKACINPDCPLYGIPQG